MADRDSTWGRYKDMSILVEKKGKKNHLGDPTV